MAGSSTSATYSNGLMTQSSHQGPSRGLQLPSRGLQLPSKNLQLPSRGLQLPSKNLQPPTTQRLIIPPPPPPPPPVTTITTTATITTITPTPAAEPVNAHAPKSRSRSRSRKRPRSIACVTCNKQKKTCGPARPCPRCLHLNIPCRQPVKPEGFLYNTKKQKTAETPLSPPVSPDDHNALSGPRSTTVSLALDFNATGKNGDTIELNSRMRSHSMSPINETPKPLPIPDMSRWCLPALPAPAEEVPYDIVKNSIFSGAPVFGLEKSTYDDILGDDIFAGFGEPIDLADVYAEVMGNMGSQGIKEGEKEGKHGAEVEHVVAQGEHVVAAGSTTSGIASETGCVSGIAWLGEADLFADSLALDDVDLSNLDIPGLDDIVIDSDIE
ncbi:uncharacterized protein LAJ45_06022 [Morchella importuna]|uniref:uncharacterized protein n=1 Tax=Morchella importuna TaxID=1174673 RepID=UPI001E8E49C0|nr:uncharacterized protein LAJ45_06022 [Morchella importuna]KAH8149870.1 hypothetical protein LAJ45_06022 [Morchella importuna]